MQISSPSPAEAAEELLKRRAARRNLLPFTEYTLAQWQTARHHEQIAEALEQVEVDVLAGRPARVVC